MTEELPDGAKVATSLFVTLHDGSFWLPNAVSFHTSFFSDVEQVRRGTAPDPCEFLGACFSGAVSFLDSRPLWALHGQDDAAFWAALEAWHREQRDRALAERPDARWTRCSHCAGAGVLPRT